MRIIFGGLEMRKTMKLCRIAKDLKQEDLARELKTSVARVSRIEKGIADLPIEEAEKLARLLGAPAEVLILNSES